MSVSAPPDIPGGTRRPRFDVLRAVPPGSRRARGQPEWRDAALAAIADAGFRNQRRIHYEGVARILMRYMDWRARTSRPGHDRIAARLGISADTVARAIAWFADRGLIGVVSPGTTPLVRAYVLHGAEGNDAAVYVLTVPRKTRGLPRVDAGQSNIADLSRPRRGLGSPSHAREAPGEGQGRNGARSARRPVLPRGGRAVPGGGAAAPGRPGAALGAVPQNRSEGLRAAAAMQERAGLLRRVSGAMLRHLARPFFAAGWTPRDVLHALDHEPGGRRHGYTGTVRAPAGWIRARLAEWTGPGGVPVPSRSQQLAAARARVLEDQAARRAAAAAAAGQAADYAAAGARARQMLRARPRPPIPAAAAAASSTTPPGST